jgi:hypothetical protein
MIVSIRLLIARLPLNGLDRRRTALLTATDDHDGSAEPREFSRGHLSDTRGPTRHEADLALHRRVRLHQGYNSAVTVHNARYVIPLRCPLVFTFRSAIRRFIIGRIAVLSVPNAAAICSPRWPGLFIT